MKRILMTIAIGLCATGLCGYAAEASTLDSGQLTVTAGPGAGIVMVTKGEVTRVELALCDKDGNAAAVTKVAKKDAQTLHITAGNIQVDVTLKKGQPFLTVEAAKPGGLLEVQATSRYAVLPDLFGYDVVYNPVRFKGAVVPVPAENFLLQFLEGNNAIMACVWPGTLSNVKGGEKKPAAAAPADRDPAVSLHLKGEGAARSFAASRIEILGGPIHVAVLEHDNIWYDQDVTALKALEPTKLEWKRPFDAHWRLNMMVAEGKKSGDLISRSQSYRFLYAPRESEKEAIRKARPADDAHMEDKRAYVDRAHKVWKKGYPTVYEEGVYIHMYEAWFNEQDTFVALYADNPGKRKPRYGIKHTGENIFDRILIYPLDRDKASYEETPLDVYTFVDIMRGTLGQEPCAYVLDLEGIKGRSAGGDREIVGDATCTIWGGHIFKATRKKELSDEERAHLIRAVKDLTVFLKAVNIRIGEYAAFNDRLAQYIEDAKQKPAVKPVTDRIGEISTSMKTMLTGYELEKFAKDVQKWDQKIVEIVAKIEDGDHKAALKLKTIRNLGQKQDNAVSDCRRWVKALRHEASFVENSDLEVRAFVLGVREMCRQILRNPHPKELLHTDPNSPRMGLTREQR